MVANLPESIAFGVLLLATVAELIHRRRASRIKRLAFGPSGGPRFWTQPASILQILGLAIASWGFASLLFVVEAEVHNKSQVAENEYKHLVLVVDVSPSMHLVDAGPEGDRSRRERASDLLESLFNRMPMRKFKITFIAVYSDAKILLEDSKDHEVVRHIMDKMPMWHAYKSGKTDLMSGIVEAAKIAKPWNPDSTYVLMLTDGDTVSPTGMPNLPASIAEFIIVGVGDTVAGSFIDGHQSRQEVNTLRQIANRLRGKFHNGNQKHLTSQIVAPFNNQNDDDANRKWKRREWSLLASVAGSSIYALIPILLHYFGSNYQGGTHWRSRIQPV